MRIWAVILIAFLFCMPAQAQMPTHFDNSFRKWSAYYMPGVPWEWLKAQCWQESRFKTDAVSPVGAKGVCQFMPNSWTDQMRKLGLEGDPFIPDLNIQASASYMRQLRDNWDRRERDLDDVHSLAMASYNAGLGNILKAQKLSGDKRLWCEIRPHLEDVTGRHHKETLHYVEVIWGYVYELEQSNRFTTD